MANYCCCTRTNYFHVKDETEFRNLVKRFYSDEDNVRIWTGQDDRGTVFAFGCYSGISGLQNASEYDGTDEDFYDEFLSGLQKCVVDDDAILIFEVGSEGLRYMTGFVTILTSHGCQNLDMTHLAMNKTAEMLGNPGWKTQCDY